MSVHKCMQHVGCDAAHGARLSATAETCGNCG